MMNSITRNKYQSKVFFMLVSIFLMALVILTGCSPSSTLPPVSTPSSSQTWSPDSSKVVSYPRADLERGIKVTIPPGDLRIILIKVEQGQKLLCYNWSAKQTDEPRIISHRVKDSEGNIIMEHERACAGCFSFPSTSGTYYLYLDNKFYTTHDMIVLLAFFWEMVPPPPEGAPAALPTSAQVNLAPYSELEVLFRNPKYSAATHLCTHSSVAISLTAGQTIQLTLESDCPINQPSEDWPPKTGVYAVLSQMRSYQQDCGWISIGSGAIDVKHTVSSNEGRKLEIVLSPTQTNISTIYKLLVCNYDTNNSHYLKYTISSYNEATSSSSPPAPVPKTTPFIIVETPTGPSTVNEGDEAVFSTSVQTNIEGSIEYRFEWEFDGYSEWSSSPSALHTWIGGTGIVIVKAQSRCGEYVSEWSSGKVVRIETQCLSRQPFGQPEQMKRYVTPNDAKVKATVDDILSKELRVFNDFEELRDWASWHISPKLDYDVHGVTEYWQLPAETLELGTGDCEDFAILLCSMLRAYGVPHDQVYVAAGFGEDKTRGHAYLVEKWYQGIWRVIEPQAGVWTGLFLMDWLTSASYEEVCCFNDQDYFEGPPTLPPGVYEFEVENSFYPLTQGATVEFERHLDAGEKVAVSFEWLKDYSIVFDWSFTIYAPNGSTALTWSGTDLQREFSFIPTAAGTYKIEILKRDALSRCARLTIEPPDWSKQ